MIAAVLHSLAAWLPLQAAAEEAVAGRQRELLFENLPPAWVLGLVLLPGVLALAFLAYRRPARPRLRRRTLAVLRAGLLALALFLAFGPFLRESRTRTEPAPLALLMDDSASMQRTDLLAPQARADLAALGIEVPAEAGRLPLLKGLLASPWRSTLEERYELQAYRFAERLTPTPVDGSALEGQGRATALGDALLGLLAENRGRRLPDVVLFSDGRSNRGAELGPVAARLGAEGVRVHVVGMGDPRPAPNLALERVQAPDLVLEGDDATFLLRVRATGAEIPSEVVVRLRDETGQILREVRVDPVGEAGAQFTMVARMDHAGQRRLVAEVEALPRETSLEDNRLELGVEVKAVRIRVLYVDGKPRWEYRYLATRLVRARRDVRVQVWLADAERGFLQEASADAPRLRRVPATVEELLDNYDVVILGDLDPGDLGADPLAGAQFLEAVAEFVRRGGGLLLAAGPRHNPAAFRGSAIEPLLPVVIGREGEPKALPVRPEPPNPELPHPVSLLDEKPQRSIELWRSAEPLWWYQPVERLRPGAQAWLVHPEAGNRFGPYVIAAGGYAPEGWVGWIGTDETWRWRWPGGERYVERFWRTMLRHVAAGRLRGGAGRVRLDVDRSRLELGDSVLVEARLRD
ncbi:MAG TPA: hypothetical protein VGC54_10750, partial [Planctomycetota bacterium]